MWTLTNRGRRVAIEKSTSPEQISGGPDKSMKQLVDNILWKLAEHFPPVEPVLLAGNRLPIKLACLSDAGFEKDYECTVKCQ